MAHVDRKQYWKIFAALAVMTALEVGVVYIPGLATGLLLTALFGLAISKATLVGLFYMHLTHETATLKMTVAIPMSLPVFYAMVLMGDAAWRLLP